MQDDTGQQPSLAQRLTRLATELAELAMTVADQEQRQRQREESVQQALTQLAELSASLHSLAGDKATQQTANPPAHDTDAAPWRQAQRSEPDEPQRW